MSDEDNKIILDLPSLEAPISAADSSTGAGLLFNDESVAQIASRLAISEGLLAIVTRDTKFADFMRDLLLLGMGAVKSEAGSILEVNPKTNCLFFRTSVGSRSDQITNYEVPIGQGIAGHVAESRQVVAVSNMDDNQMALRSIQNAVGFMPRNLVAIPILVRGKIYGVLELMNRFGQDVYSESDIEILKYFADMASKAIEIRLMIAWNAKKNLAALEEYKLGEAA